MQASVCIASQLRVFLDPRSAETAGGCFSPRPVKSRAPLNFDFCEASPLAEQGPGFPLGQHLKVLMCPGGPESLDFLAGLGLKCVGGGGDKVLYMATFTTWEKLPWSFWGQEHGWSIYQGPGNPGHGALEELSPQRLPPLPLAPPVPRKPTRREAGDLERIESFKRPNELGAGHWHTELQTTRITRVTHPPTHTHMFGWFLNIAFDELEMSLLLRSVDT